MHCKRRLENLRSWEQGTATQALEQHKVTVNFKQIPLNVSTVKAEYNN